LIGSGGFIYKSKGGIGSGKYRASQKGVKYWREITIVGVKTAAVCLGELQLLGREAKNGSACLKPL